MTEADKKLIELIKALDEIYKPLNDLIYRPYLPLFFNGLPYVKSSTSGSIK